jgi:hypothetical protein
MPMSDKPTDVREKKLRGWHNRGYLPHFDAGHDFTQFVSFRLADSLPKHVVKAFLEELASQPETKRRKQLNRLIEEFTVSRAEFI